jgi:tetratricopeptide (TPR) repeat protein
VLGQVLLKRRRNKQAAAAFRAALAIDPQNPGARWSLADALLRSERSGDALNEFAQLASEDPAQRAHSHNVLVAFGNSLRFVYFAVVVPYLVMVRILPRVTEDGTTLVRGLLALSVVLAFAIVVPLAIRFVRRLQVTWRSLLALVVVQDRLLVAWAASIALVLALEVVALALPDGALAILLGVIAIPTTASIVLWVIRLAVVSRRSRALST